MDPLAKPIIQTRTIITVLIVASLLIIAIYLFEQGALRSSNGPPLSSFKVEKLEIMNANNQSIVISGLVYVASSTAEQTQGFQNARSFGNCNGLSINSSTQCIGMLFVTNNTTDLCFWMHDTPMALQQVWISSSGTVLNSYNATPESDNSVCHTAMDVLETSPGYPILLGDLVIESP